jgi:hypothetical protein
MATQQNDRKTKFLAELVAQIQNEQYHFDMEYFTTTSTTIFPDPPVTCDTASCIAGHIEALRPESGFPGGSHATRAAAIYRAETGEPCRLDFYGANYRDADGFHAGLKHITREEAVAHILGESENWPQLDYDHGEYLT